MLTSAKFLRVLEPLHSMGIDLLKLSTYVDALRGYGPKLANSRKCERVE